MVALRELIRRDGWTSWRLGAVLAMILAPWQAKAPEGARPVVGAGMFLSHDRGWNFNRNLFVLAGVTAPAGSSLRVRVITIGRFSSAGEELQPALPQPTRSANSGLSFALHVQTRAHRSGLYAVAGPEYFALVRQRQVTEGRVGGAVGLGLAGTGGRWALEGRYVRYTRSIASTRGHLDLGVLRSF